MTRVRNLAATGLAAAALLTVPTVALAASHTVTPTVLHRDALAPFAASHTAPIPGYGGVSTATPHAIVVRPGQQLSLGEGYRISLTADAETITTPDGTTESYPVNLANQPSGVSELLDGALFTGLYVGGGQPDHVRVTEGSATYTGPVVTLAGNPGWATFYALTSTDNAPGTSSVTVYNAAGSVLASYSSPMVARTAS